MRRCRQAEGLRRGQSRRPGGGSRRRSRVSGAQFLGAGLCPAPEPRDPLRQDPRAAGDLSLSSLHLSVVLCVSGSRFAPRRVVLARPGLDLRKTEMNNVVRYANPDDDFELREEMIPMRDGAMLHTLILDRKSTRLNSSHMSISYAV